MEMNSIFQEAREEFLRSLSPNEKSRFAFCSSGKELLRDIKSIDCLRQEGHNKPKARQPLTRLQPLNEKLEPYFQVIGILVSSHPEYAAVGWGALCLVLQV